MSSQAHDLAGIAGGGSSSLNPTTTSILATTTTVSPDGPSSTTTTNESARDASDSEITPLAVKDQFDVFRPRTLHIANPYDMNLSNEKAAEILKEVRQSFVVDKASNHGSFIKLIFHTKELADACVNKTMTINNKEITLTSPTSSPYVTRTLHVFGLPFEVPDNILRDFLKSKGVTTVHPGRFIKWRGTDIDSPGRSFVIQSLRSFEIPPFFRWDHPNFKKGFINIRLWYPNMPEFCKKCNKSGYNDTGCQEFPRLDDAMPALQTTPVNVHRTIPPAPQGTTTRSISPCVIT